MEPPGRMTMRNQFDAAERAQVPPMRLIVRRALAQAEVDRNIQQSALDRARDEGDLTAVVHYRNARDRNRLAIRWIRSRIAKES